MLTYIVLFYDFLPILKKCLLLAASLVDHLNLTFTCECKEPVEPRGSPVCFGVILKNTVPLPPRRQGLSMA